MKQRNQIVFSIFLLLCFFSYGQENKGDRKMSKAEAEMIVNETLKDTTVNNLVSRISFLKTEKKAIEFAELVLFEIYGKENIERQKPYNIHKVGNYWLITGTLPKGWRGGTFLIIIDTRNCKIIRLTHGK